MKKRMLNIVVFAASVAVACFLHLRCGDAAEQPVVSESRPKTLCAEKTRKAKALDRSMPGQVSYAIEWDCETDRFIVKGRQIKKNRWQCPTFWQEEAVATVAWVFPASEETKVFVPSMDWGVVELEPGQNSPANSSIPNSFNSPIDRFSPRHTWER